MASGRGAGFLAGGHARSPRRFSAYIVPLACSEAADGRRAAPDLSLPHTPSQNSARYGPHRLHGWRRCQDDSKPLPPKLPRETVVQLPDSTSRLTEGSSAPRSGPGLLAGPCEPLPSHHGRSPPELRNRRTCAGKKPEDAEDEDSSGGVTRCGPVFLPSLKRDGLPASADSEGTSGFALLQVRRCIRNSVARPS